MKTKYLLEWNDGADSLTHDEETFDTKEEALERLEELKLEYEDLEFKLGRARRVMGFVWKFIEVKNGK